MISNTISGDIIFLRRLNEGDVTDTYVKWLNDPEINQYLESRFTTHTMDETKAFIRSITNEYNYQFGIFVKETGKHIGNIKVGGINPIHKYADVSFLIGEKDYWGQGIATEAIRLATDFGFNTLGLHKLWGGLMPLTLAL